MYNIKKVYISVFLSAKRRSMFWHTYSKNNTVSILAIATRPQYTANSEIVLEWNHQNQSGLVPTSSAGYLLLDSSSLFLPDKKKRMEHQHNHLHVNWISCSKQTFLDQFLRLQKGCFQSTQPFGYQKLRHFQGPQRKTAVIFCTTALPMQFVDR